MIRKVSIAWGCFKAGFMVLLGIPDDKESDTQWVLDNIMSERMVQNQRWGPKQSHPNHTGSALRMTGGRSNHESMIRFQHFNNMYQNPYWSTILAEEFYEAMNETDPVKLRKELVQVAAVAVSWIEDLDRKRESRC